MSEVIRELKLSDENKNRLAEAFVKKCNAYVHSHIDNYGNMVGTDEMYSIAIYILGVCLDKFRYKNESDDIDRMFGGYYTTSLKYAFRKASYEKNGIKRQYGKTLSNISAARERLLVESGDAPTPKDIADRLNMSEAYIARVEGVAIDSTENHTVFEDELHSINMGDDVVDNIISRETKRRIEYCINNILIGRERDIAKRAILGDELIIDIYRQLGFTSSQTAYRYKDSALAKIRNYIQEGE